MQERLLSRMQSNSAFFASHAQNHPKLSTIMSLINRIMWHTTVEVRDGALESDYGSEAFNLVFGNATCLL